MTSRSPLSGAPLRTDGVSFSRGGRMLIDGIDCTVEAGSLTALVGPNGAGKSTLLHLIAAAEAPTAGAIELGGTDARSMRRRARARYTALVEQQADTDLDLSVLDVVLLGRTPHLSVLGGPDQADAEIARAALGRAGAEAFSERRFQELSGGERQRVLLARALAQKPTLLLMDEPTNHLDIHAQLHTLGLMRKLADDGIAILAALHDLPLAARYADQVIVVDHGRVVASGAPAEILTPELIQLVYGVRADVLAHPVDGSPLIAFSPLETDPTNRVVRRSGGDDVIVAASGPRGRR
ncbi:ABC transporter ATP-binding protein [Microbacterium sp.]|uniref:ABC transporter ATP-binding protein n=1 Tax=Microbacterium sp. TaxID=51671 RepID=UPI003561916C